MFGATPHLPGICTARAASLLPGTHHLDPVQENKHPSRHLCKCPVVRLYLCSIVPYKNSEIAWGAGDVSGRGQGLGDVFHAEGCGQDPQGQADHKVALRAFECPAVTWVHIRLGGRLK